MTSADFRRAARESLRGKWKKVLPVFLPGTLIINSFGLSSVIEHYFGRIGLWELRLPGVHFSVPYVLPVGAGWLIAALMFALQLLAMAVSVGIFRVGGSILDGKLPSVKQLFPRDVFGKAIALGILYSLMQWLAQLPLMLAQGLLSSPAMGAMLLASLLSLLSIALTIMIYGYAMAMFILAVDPEKGPVQALRESRVRMNGRKWKYFCLDFSFLGWVVLYTVVSGAVGTLLPPVPAVILSLILIVPLDAYMQVSLTAFFRNAMQPGMEPPPPQWKAGTEEQSAEETNCNAERRVTVLTADETVAKDLFMQHGCSRRRLSEEDLLEAYESLRIDLHVELRWLREYGNLLMRRFDRDPAALDELLALSAEYGMDDLLSRALERVERHIRQETLPEAEILNMAERILALATSVVFADQGGYVQRKREQISDIADRMEHRLSERDPDGVWQETLRSVRSMCRSAQG